MAIEYTADSLDGIDESLHGAYEERDGKFHFNADKYVELKTSGLKKNQTDLKKEKDKAKAELDALKKRYADISDDDFKAFSEWRERKEIEGDDDGGNAGDGKKRADDLHKRYQDQLKSERGKWESTKAAEVAEKDREIAEWRSKFEQEKLTNRLTALCAKAGVFDDDLETFVDLMIYKGHFGLVDDEVTFLEDGEPSTTTPDKAIAEKLKEKYPRFYQAADRGGSGAQQAQGAGRSQVDWKKLSPADRIAYARRQNTKARA